MSATQAPNLSVSYVREVRATFPNDAALSDAVTRLTDAGFDRASMVVPDPVAVEHGDSNIAETDTPKPEDDRRQLRTLHSSTAAAAGAMAGAAAVVATGGAVLPAIAAAAGVGALAGGGMFAATNASDIVQSSERDAIAAVGLLNLSVAVTDAAQQSLVENVMRHSGATQVHAELRGNAAIAGQQTIVR